MGQFNGQLAVVTGGNGGIGKAIVEKLLEEGAQVAVIGTNSQTGHALIEEMRTQFPQGRLAFYAINVAHTAQVELGLKQIAEEMGPVEILINNAGITADQLLMRMSEEEWDRVLAVNLKSCYNTCRAVVRPMLKARRGSIVNVSSVVGLVGNAGQTNYAASKAGMIGFTKALAVELAPKNVRVNCVAPGFIQTAMTDRLSAEQKERLSKEIPLGWMGEPRDIAHAVSFLVSSDARYITGQILTVDGGMVR